MSYVGVPHDVQLDAQKLFFTHVHLHGGPAPVRRYLPKLIDLISTQTVDPGKVFDLTLPLERVADGYRAMDERRAIKTLLRVNELGTPGRRTCAQETTARIQGRDEGPKLPPRP